MLNPDKKFIKNNINRVIYDLIYNTNLKTKILFSFPLFDIFMTFPLFDTFFQFRHFVSQKLQKKSKCSHVISFKISSIS